MRCKERGRAEFCDFEKRCKKDLKNIASVRNCPDVTILNSLIGLCLLSFCLFVFLTFCLFVFLSFYLFIFLSFKVVKLLCFMVVRLSGVRGCKVVRL